MAAELHRIWAAATSSIGPAGDFTRIYEAVEAARRQQPLEKMLPDPARLDTALAVVCMVAVREQLGVAEGAGLDPERAARIVDAGTGRSEATRRFPGWFGIAAEEARTALRHALELATASGSSAPLVAVAARHVPEGGL